MTAITPEAAPAPQPYKLVGVAFIVLDVVCTIPVELVPHHTLRRASTDEVKIIKNNLIAGAFIDPTVLLEGVYQNGSYERSVNPSDWRYWVVEVGQDHVGAMNEGLHDLSEAARLTSVGLRFPLIIFPNGAIGIGGRIGDNIFRNFEESLFLPPMRIDEAYVVLLRELCAGIKAVKAEPTFKPISRAIGMYDRLSATPDAHNLYVLGLFAVLESILTHNPSKEGYDSLTHQIKTKMHLLNRRFDEALDTTAFRNCDFIKLWSELYGFRSRIAHGADFDFQNKQNLLRDYKTTLSFLEQTIKKVLRHALKNHNS